MLKNNNLTKVKLGIFLVLHYNPWNFSNYKYDIVFKSVVHSLQDKLWICSNPDLQLKGNQFSVLFPKWQNVALLEQEEDVNQLTEFFSYEHFYVIYCKFWELDTDHDLYIDQRDLAQHNDQGATSHFLHSFTDHSWSRPKVWRWCLHEASLILSGLSRGCYRPLQQSEAVWKWEREIWTTTSLILTLSGGCIVEICLPSTW